MGWFANGSLVSGIRAVFRNQTCAHALMRARVCMMMSVQLGQVICSIDARNVARRCVFSISDRYLSILQDIMRSLSLQDIHTGKAARVVMHMTIV